MNNKSSLIEKEMNDETKNLIQSLIDSHHDFNTQDKNGNTILMVFARTKQEDHVKSLLAAGASVTMLNNNKKNALHFACQYQPLQRNISTLLFHEYCKRFTSLEEAAQSLINDGFEMYHIPYFGSIEVLKYFLKKRLPVNSKHPSTMQTAIHASIIFKDMACTKLLLECTDLDLNAVDYQGLNPLGYIFQGSENSSEELELLQIFLNLGSEPTLCTSLGFFQVTHILANGDHEVVSVLLQSKIDYAAKDKISGKSMLHYLAANENPGIADELEKHIHKFDVNVFDRCFSTPIYIAVTCHNSSMVQFLLDHHANPNLCNAYSRTPLYYAYQNFKQDFEDKCDECIELLLHYNANPQFIFTENNGQITIFDAAKKGGSLHKLGPVVAYLAMIERPGIALTEITYSKMNSYPPLRQYFDRCKELLQENISGSVTLLKFLTSDLKQLVKYCRNEEIMLKLRSNNYNQYLQSACMYYYQTLSKWLLIGIQKKGVFDGVANVVYEIFKGRIKSSNLVIDKIIEYLDEDSLLQVYKLSKTVGVLHTNLSMLNVTDEPDRQ